MSTTLAAQTNPSRNPFRSNPATPNVTGAGQGSDNASLPASAPASGPTDTTPPPPFFSTSLGNTSSGNTNAEHTSQNQFGQGLDGRDVEEPPPYTPNPSSTMGEVTVEQGPSRPFQPAPRPGGRPGGALQNSISGNRVQNHSSSGIPPSSSNPSLSNSLNTLLSEFRDTVNQAVRGLNSPSQSGTNGYLSPQPTGQSGWSSYPGTSQPQHRPTQSQPQYAPPSHPPPRSSMHAAPPLAPPPLHPASSLSSPTGRSSTSSMRRRSSEFVRDFYATGTAENLVREVQYEPPPGPPPPHAPSQRPMATGSSSQSVPDDGRPTTQPAIGHPLLKDGKLLVYPKGHKCDKCQNVGYKEADPLRPCKKCWKKYAKPFTGPLVYSFNNLSSPDSTAASSSTNFQRPLPYVPPPAPPPVPPTFSLSPPPAHFAQGGYMSNHHGGFYTPPTGYHPRGMSRPSPGSVVYMAGDPRIGGRLCWRCNGKGNTSFLLLDRITCDVCGGVGRVMD